MLAIYIIAGLFVLLILILCIPVEVIISLNTESSKKNSLTLSWLFGIVKKDLIERRLKKKKILKITAKKKRLPSRLDIDFVSQIVNSTGLVKRFINFFSIIYRQIKIKEISGDLVVGLENPVHTGMLFALVGPVNALLNQHPRYNVSIRPYFDEEKFLAGNLNGNARFRPIRFIYPVLKLAASKEVRRIGKDFIKKKWRSKRKNDSIFPWLIPPVQFRR